MSHWNIAIDGPAGAGKSTIAKAVAQRLGILYLDTGAMYRALALKALRCGIAPGDAERVVPMLADTEIRAKNVEGVQHTYLDGEDVSALIRTEEVSRGASAIGAISQVREKMVQAQQSIAMDSDVVMDGRDICAYVLPWSRNKFYVTASSLERARRRLLELQSRGEGKGVTLEEMQAQIEKRDYADSHRACMPLARTEDAVLIDTTHMDIDAAVEALLGRLEP